VPCGLFSLFTSRSPNTTLIILIKNILLLLIIHVVSFCLTAIDMLQNKHLATRLDYNIIIAPRNKKSRGDRRHTNQPPPSKPNGHTTESTIRKGQLVTLYILRRMRHHHSLPAWLINSSPPPFPNYITITITLRISRSSTHHPSYPPSPSFIPSKTFSLSLSLSLP
jgi:hypothetical protein